MLSEESRARFFKSFHIVSTYETLRTVSIFRQDQFLPRLHAVTSLRHDMPHSAHGKASMAIHLTTEKRRDGSRENRPDSLAFGCFDTRFDNARNQRANYHRE